LVWIICKSLNENIFPFVLVKYSRVEWLGNMVVMHFPMENTAKEFSECLLIFHSYQLCESSSCSILLPPLTVWVALRLHVLPGGWRSLLVLTGHTFILFGEVSAPTFWIFLNSLVVSSELSFEVFFFYV
jgi:hypothetical protein